MKDPVMLIPDVHGRTFWKEAKEFDGEIVFLGDYVDPYTYYEEITSNEALANFEEILEFAKSNPKVTLLLGNHDLTYFVSTLICECRTDYENFPKIHSLFYDNKDMFKLAKCIEYNGETVLLTHAGVHVKWLEPDIEERDPFKVADILNEKFSELVHRDQIPRRDPFISMLADVSYYRGGWTNTGSCVWADVHEWEVEELFNGEKLDCYQIFGHTRLEKGYPVIGKNIACIDARECYTLDYILEKRKENIEKNESERDNS